jgi:hypothetical protein
MIDRTQNKTGYKKTKIGWIPVKNKIHSGKPNGCFFI